MTNARNSTPHRRLARFIRDDAGNVAMLFGILLLPMLGCVGLAIDFGSILTARNKAQVAADAAALQASGVARDIIKAGDGTESSTNAAIAEAKSRAEKLFKVHAEQSGLKNYTSTVSMARTGQNIATTVSYTVNTTTYIAKMFGQTAYASTGVAQSSSSLPSYTDVHVLMDVSQSMGLAATNAEAVKLFNLTSPNCVFGCHVKQSGQKSLLPFEQIAQNNGIRLRIDVLRDAVTKMVQDAQDNAYGDSVYRFGFYTLSLDASMTTQVLNVIAPLSGNYSSLKIAAKDIDLSANNDASGRGDSHIHAQLDALKLKVANSGDGSSDKNARVYVFLVTDGLRDYRTNGAVNQHVTGPIDPTYCSQFKTTSAGITVGVLYTTYLPIYADPKNPSGALEGNYTSLVKPHVANIPVKLKDCASPNWFFEASDDASITAAFDKMFAQTSQSPKLTN